MSGHDGADPQARGCEALLAVIGNPVLQSRSPLMFRAAFAALGIQGNYVRLAAESAQQALATAVSAGITGMNVTAPFKEEMARIVDEIEPCARRVGAVNTVRVCEGRTEGHNTDVEGVTQALVRHGVPLCGGEAVVLGTGGAARAVVAAIVGQGAQVTVVGRNVGKAALWAPQLGAAVAPLEDQSLRAILPRCVLLVGCTTAIGRLVPRDALRPELAVLEAQYAKETALAADARSVGCRVIDGRDWLVYQALAAFRLMTGRDGPEDGMRQAVYGVAAGDLGPTKRSILLVGFMGSGKSTVARELQAITGMRLADLDEQVEQRAGMPVARIFETAGESGFRQMERDALEGLTQQAAAGCIVSCGGGVVLAEENRAWLRANGVVVWLWADPTTTSERVGDGQQRPMLHGSDREVRVRTLLRERRARYAEVSDLMIATEGTSPKRIAERIVDEIHRTYDHLR